MASIPTVSVERMRSDFALIFGAENITASRQSDSDETAGDLGNVAGSNTPANENIDINIQGLSSAIQRLRDGVTEKDGRFHAFVEYDTTIEENDIITVTYGGKTYKFRVDNYSEGIHPTGAIIFKEFDLVYLQDGS